MTGMDKLTLAEARALVAELTGILDFVATQTSNDLTARQIAEVVAELPGYQRATKLFEKIEEPSC
jgi:hypothetical protein